MQVQCAKVRLHSDVAAETLEWFAGLSDDERRRQIQSLLVEEGMVVETVFTETDESGAVWLYVYQRGADFQAADRAVQASSNPLAEETRQVMTRAFAEARLLTLVTDLPAHD